MKTLCCYHYNDIQEQARNAFTYVSLPDVFRSSDVVASRAIVTEIKLGMMVVKVQNKSNSYMAIPVWDFYGYWYDRYESEADSGWVLDSPLLPDFEGDFAYPQKDALQHAQELLHNLGLSDLQLVDVCLIRISHCRFKKIFEDFCRLARRGSEAVAGSYAGDTAVSLTSTTPPNGKNSAKI